MSFSSENQTDSDLLNLNLLKISEELNLLIGNETYVAGNTTFPFTTFSEQSNNVSSEEVPRMFNTEIINNIPVDDQKKPGIITNKSQLTAALELAYQHHGKIRNPQSDSMNVLPNIPMPPDVASNGNHHPYDSEPLLSNVVENIQGDRYGYPRVNCASYAPQKSSSFSMGKKSGTNKRISALEQGIIGLDENGKERNQVLRIFQLFYEMHYYMNDTLPSPNAMNTVENISLVPPVRASMPITMSIQFQVKQAIHKCMMYICDQERIINAIKLLDREMYEECEGLLRLLRRTLNQFETYKRLDLEHKRGKFVNTKAIKIVDQMEVILQHICDLLRETNVVVHIFNWSVAKRYERTPIYRPLQIPTLHQEFILEKSQTVTMGFRSTDLFFQIMQEVYEEKNYNVIQHNQRFCNLIVPCGSGMTCFANTQDDMTCWTQFGNLNGITISNLLAQFRIPFETGIEGAVTATVAEELERDTLRNVG